MEERGLTISRKKTEYMGRIEHQDAEIHLHRETVTRVKTFTYLGSTLERMENWMRKSPTQMEELEESVWSVVRQENDSEDQG